MPGLSFLSGLLAIALPIVSGECRLTGAQQRWIESALAGWERVRARALRLPDDPLPTLIFFDRGSSDWTLTHGLFRRAALVPNVALEVETIETAKRMVERGMGLAFLPHLAVGRELRRRSLVAIEIADAEPLSRSLDMIHPRQRPLSAEARALLAALRSALSDAGSPPRRRR